MAIRADADLLAGGQEHVHLAGRGPLADLAGQVDQFVGGVAPGRDDHERPASPRWWARIARRAAARILSAVATLVPPNFWTRRGTGVSSGTFGTT